MSEHDLREGSKPKCPKCGNHWPDNHGYFGNVVTCFFCRTEFVCNSVADFAQFFPIAAILEKNRRLRGTFCEAHAAEDCKSCPCCEAVHQDDLRKAAKAENQRLAKELEESRRLYAMMIDSRANAEDESDSAYKQLKAAEAKLGKMREALETIAGFAPGNGDVCEIIARRARAALAE